MGVQPEQARPLVRPGAPRDRALRGARARTCCWRPPRSTSPSCSCSTALYVIAGGIRLSGDLEATPLVNTTFLAAGSVLASFLGTTGASMLLIRPVLQTNRQRTHITHTVIFFIFLVVERRRPPDPARRPAAVPRLPPGGAVRLDLPAPAALAVRRAPSCCSSTSSGTRWRTGGSRPGRSSATRRERRPLRLAGDAQLRLARRGRAGRRVPPRALAGGADRRPHRALALADAARRSIAPTSSRRTR